MNINKYKYFKYKYKYINYKNTLNYQPGGKKNIDPIEININNEKYLCIILYKNGENVQNEADLGNINLNEYYSNSIIGLYNPKQRLKFNIKYHPNNYFTIFLLDESKKFIVGLWDGNFNIINNIKYSTDSSGIIIHPKYQKLGICKIFSTKAFEIMRQIGIQVLCVNNSAKVIGCKCYLQAAENAGFDIYLHDINEGIINITKYENVLNNYTHICERHFETARIHNFYIVDKNSKINPNELSTLKCFE